MSTVKATNFQHPSAASPAIVLDAAGGATVAGMGLVLVKPTSIANSGGSASLSGGAVTFTGVSSVSLNGVFSAAYDNYTIVFRGLASSAGDIDARLRLSGTDATTNYARQFISATGTAVGGARETSQTFARFIAGNITTATAITQVFSPAQAAVTAFQSHTGTATSGSLFALVWGQHTTTTAYDGITFFPSSGTITGTVRIYGYQNS